ncbi:DUF2207 domain-containing protein [Streptococcus sp. E29BA]|uniref:DUF2207 family protein n=2 Tax=unclassified Streptococcus TaxID=2608887 RepID=UPI00359D8E8D
MMMKKQLWLGLMLLFGWLILFRVEADDVDYRIPSYEAEVTFFADNTADLVQTITFDYQSSFRGQYITLGTAGALPEGATIVGTPEVLAYKNDTLVPVTIEEENWSDGRKLKIYNAGESGDKVRLVVHWRLENFLTLYPDIARLNWVPISDWEVPLEQVRFTIKTAKSSQMSQLAVHRGYFRPRAEIRQVDQAYDITATDVSGELHLHAYWDKGIIDAPAQLTQAGLPLYQEVETQIARKQKSLSFRLEILFVALAGGGLILGLVTLVFFRRLVRQQGRLPHRVYELPDDLPPLLVAQSIFNQSLRDTAPTTPGYKGELGFENMLQASLLDLIDRRYLRVDGTGEQASLSIVHLEGLADFELALLDMAFGTKTSCPVTALFSAYAYDDEEEEALKKHYRGTQLEKRIQGLAQSHLSRYRSGLKLISSRVSALEKELGTGNNYRPLNAREKGTYRAGMGLVTVSLLLSIYSILALLVHAFRPAVLSYLLIAGLAIGLLIWGTKMHQPFAQKGVLTTDGKTKVEPWLGFWQMLKDIKSFDRVELEGLVVWNRLLVYATLFGEAKRVEQYLRLHQIELPEDTGLTLTHGHYGFLHHSLQQNMVTSSQLATTASHFSVSSGSSGISGGFSGGGGGGGGGSF